MSYYQSWQHQKNCAMAPIPNAVVMGAAFTALDVVQGAPFNPRSLGLNIGGLYLYHVLQCPMEAISGGPSAFHNIASGGLIGFMGVRAGVLGIPLVDPYFLMRNPNLSPPLIGAAVYSGIAGIFVAFSGKPF